MLVPHERILTAAGRGSEACTVNNLRTGNAGLLHGVDTLHLRVVSEKRDRKIGYAVN
jgi:hypothetical protein